MFCFARPTPSNSEYKRIGYRYEKCSTAEEVAQMATDIIFSPDDYILQVPRKEQDAIDDWVSQTFGDAFKSIPSDTKEML